MTNAPYYHVDAFADRPFAGNQAAVMPMDQWLDDDVLCAIAAENMFAETAYYRPDTTGAADYELRWFTPELEVAMCGHATLATAHIILSQKPDRDKVTFATRQSGILTVLRDDDGYALALPVQRPSPKPMPNIVKLLGGLPNDTQYAEGGYNVICYDHADDVVALAPDMAQLKALGNQQFICTAPGAGHHAGTDIISRVFVPGAGIDEDSVTGSAHAVLTPYWAKKLGRDRFSAFQASTRGGLLSCREDGDLAWLSGQCVTVVEGRFKL